MDDLSESTSMTQAEKDMLLYLYAQFPATVGHLALRHKIRAIRNEALDEAALYIENQGASSLRKPFSFYAQQISDLRNHPAQEKK